MPLERSQRPTVAGAPSCGAATEPAGIWRVLGDRLQRRSDSEHEQVLIRIGFAIAILFYVGVVAMGERPWPMVMPCLMIAIWYLMASSALFGHLLWRPEISPQRRFAGMLLDLITLPFGMVVGGELVAPLYPMFLWISLGMGFRYGRRYLFVAAGLSLLGFAVVIALSDFWRSMPALAASLWIALLVLPAYTSTLLNKLTAAIAHAEEASRTKSRFLATMSHELRTPLHAILGMSDLLRATRLNIEQQEMVRTVRSAGQTLLDMIDDVLDIAKIEAGSVEAQSMEFDLHEILATVRTLLHHQAVGKGLALQLNLDAAAPYRLMGASRSLRQILVNLVANAIKFTDHGSITIKVSAGAFKQQKAGALRIEVRDTGVGIPAEAQVRIFERFTQGDESTTRTHGGAGLGLAIAHELATLMGGTLKVQSSLRSGTCFVLQLQFARLPDEAPRRLEGRVVVVGPPSQIEAYSRRLTTRGVDAVPAVDVLEAIEILARGRDRAVLVIEASSERRYHSLPAALARRFPTEPLNLILIGTDEHAMRSDYLAVLPQDVDDARLHTAVHAALAMPQVPAETNEAWISDRIGRRILVAEDNRINQKVLEKMLRSGGHVVTIVDNGEQALDALEAQDFDLALLDLNMPIMGGLEAFKLHRFATGGKGNPPFVALTADATEESRKRCLEAGIDAYLTKPIDTDHLLALVDRLTQSTDSSTSDVGAVVVRDPRLVGRLPVLDRTHLDRLRQLDDGDDFVVEVVQDFIADAEGLVAELEMAAAVGNAKTFRDNAHALRSSAAHMGATALFELCLEWRGIDQSELVSRGAGYAARLRSEFERLRAALLGLVASSPGHPSAMERPR